jgi:hypothetical protein
MIPTMNWSSCSGPSGNAATLDCLPLLLQVIISWLLTFAGVVALFLIIYAGIRFITSGGDAKSVDGAKKTLSYAIVGLVLILLSFFIINLIAYATGVSCINFLGFSACQ